MADRIQTYLYESARRRSTFVLVPPFTLFLHATSTLPDLNYAIPTEPGAGNWVAGLAELRTMFLAHGRHPRLVFVAASAPGLAAASAAAGWRETEHEALMVATPATLQPPALLPGLEVVALDATAPLDMVRENLDTNEQGFNPGAARPVVDADALAFRAGLATARAFTARLAGQPVGAGMFTTPLAGVTELAGITTLIPFRRRGIAAALTAAMAQVAFAQGVDLAFLGVHEDAAARVYAWVGFRPCSALLTYSRPALAP